VRLILVRHAEAAPGTPDADRRLTPHGRDQARALGRRLADERVRPDALLTSPLARAIETAELVGDSLGVEPEHDGRLAPGATAERVVEAVAGRGDVVVVVGHQPDCGRVAAALGGGREPDLPTAGTVTIDLP
jgi:phosphohistidine phosphatase